MKLKSVSENIGLGIIVALVIAAVLAVGAGLTGAVRYSGYLVRSSTARTALDTQGFRDIRIVKRTCWFIRWKGGGRDDVVRFTAEAVNPAGKTVRVYVFAGWPFKGATVRTP